MREKDKENLKLTQQLRFDPKRGSSPPKNDKSHEEGDSHNYKKQLDQKEEALKSKERVIEDLKRQLNVRKMHNRQVQIIGYLIVVVV